jgi:hypothetical protein
MFTDADNVYADIPCPFAVGNHWQLAILPLSEPANYVFAGVKNLPQNCYSARRQQWKKYDT